MSSTTQEVCPVCVPLLAASAITSYIHKRSMPRGARASRGAAARLLRAARCVGSVVEVVVMLAVLAVAVALMVRAEVVVEEFELIEHLQVDA